MAEKQIYTAVPSDEVRKQVAAEEGAVTTASPRYTAVTFDCNDVESAPTARLLVATPTKASIAAIQEAQTEEQPKKKRCGCCGWCLIILGVFTLTMVILASMAYCKIGSYVVQYTKSYPGTNVAPSVVLPYMEMEAIHDKLHRFGHYVEACDEDHHHHHHHHGPHHHMRHDDDHMRHGGHHHHHQHGPHPPPPHLGDRLSFRHEDEPQCDQPHMLELTDVEINALLTEALSEAEMVNGGVHVDLHSGYHTAEDDMAEEFYNDAVGEVHVDVSIPTDYLPRGKGRYFVGSATVGLGLDRSANHEMFKALLKHVMLELEGGTLTVQEDILEQINDALKDMAFEALHNDDDEDGLPRIIERVSIEEGKIVVVANGKKMAE